MPSNGQPVTDSETWSRLDHFDEDVCARVRIALLESPGVQDFLINASELDPHRSLGYWHLLQELERLSDGFLTAQQGHLLCDRLRDADRHQRPVALDGISTLWGALPPISPRNATAREGRRRWPKETSVEVTVASLVARFPDPGGDDEAGEPFFKADESAAAEQGLRPSSGKVARHRLRRHLPQND